MGLLQWTTKPKLLDSPTGSLQVVVELKPTFAVGQVVARRHAPAGSFPMGSTSERLGSMFQDLCREEYSVYSHGSRGLLKY